MTLLLTLEHIFATTHLPQVLLLKPWKTNIPKFSKMMLEQVKQGECGEFIADFKSCRQDFFAKNYSFVALANILSLTHQQSIILWYRTRWLIYAANFLTGFHITETLLFNEFAELLKFSCLACLLRIIIYSQIVWVLGFNNKKRLD